MRRIGRYQVVGELGRGAMGVVYRCTDPNIGREIAVKIIRMAGGENTEVLARQRDRLFREARSAGILNHPNIVTVYDIGEEDRVAYIAMELVDGTSLDALLNDSDALPRERILRILLETAQGLDYAHRKGIIHRDIKPANVMVDESGRVRITDFGIAKFSTSEQMTQTGFIMGTPNYMSPEQVQGKPVSGVSDQYSLAVIAYEMLTGERPFLADQLPTLVYKIVCEEPVPPQNLNPTLGESIAGVIRRGLAKLPEDRYPSCAAFVQDLQAACDSTPNWRSIPRGGANVMPTLAATAPAMDARTHAAALPPPAKRVLAPEPSPRSKAPLVALVLLLIGVAGAGGYWYWQQRAEAIELARQAAIPVAKPVETAPAQPAEPAPADPATKEPEAEAPKPEEPKPEEPKPEEPKPAEPVKPAVKAPPPAPTLQLRSIAVRTDPPGARVVLDGLAGTACITPCSVQADAGHHTIQVKRPGFAEIRRSFFVSDEPVELGMIALEKATGNVFLRSDPAGATVLVNDKPWPQATPTQLTLPIGTHKITVQKGSVVASQNVQINEGEIKQISVTLPR